MITTADASLHAPAAPDWAETNFWSFQIPEVGLTGGVYALIRAQHGIALSTVHLNSRRTTTHWEAEYCDLQMHLPIGADFDLLDYSLANGLRVRVAEPNMGWEVDYDDGQGTGVHFTYRALMPPFDIHDPEMDPMVAAGTDGHDYAWGTAYNGHFDQSGVYEGEVVLPGRRIPFRSVGTMDHSWGPRPERHRSTLSWVNAHFSEDFVVHALCDFDPAAGGTALRFTHGYVLENGRLTGLAGGSGTTRRRGWFPEDIVLDVRDAAGRGWSLRGQARTSFPWLMWPDVVGFNALISWECGGRRGFGEVYDVIGLHDLTAGGLGQAGALFRAT
jgi:hypothetical protein